MNNLIKYIFIVLILVVSSHLLSQSPTPIHIYEKLENGDINLINKNVKLSYKIIGQPDDSLKSIPLRDSIFELSSKIKDWIEVRIVENATKKTHIRKVYSPYHFYQKNGIQFFIGNSALYDFSSITMHPYYTPVVDRVYIKKINYSGDNLIWSEYKNLLFQQGFEPIDHHFSVFKWGEKEVEKSKQIDFLIERNDIRAYPLYETCKESTQCSFFLNTVDILIRDSINQKTLNKFFENLKLLKYYPLRKAKGPRDSKSFTDYFDKYIPYRIEFSEKDMLSYVFLEKLNLLYQNENVLLIYQKRGVCTVTID